MTAPTRSGPHPRSVDRIPIVTGSTFGDRILHAEGPVVVEFMSYGCSHCRALEPILQEVAEALGPSLSIFRVNVPVERELAYRYAIDGTPTLVMFLGGGEVGRVQGPSPDVSTLLIAVTRPFGGAK